MNEEKIIKEKNKERFFSCCFVSKRKIHDVDFWTNLVLLLPQESVDPKYFLVVDHDSWSTWKDFSFVVAQAYQGLINDGDEIGETAWIHTESEPHTYPVRVISRCRLLCKTDWNGALLDLLYNEDIRWPADLFYQAFLCWLIVPKMQNPTK